MNVEQARFNMIEQQIRPWDVLDPAVLELLSLVRREDFVPTAYRGLAFMDLELPLGDGQSMLAPRVEARLLQDLAVKKHERVLEVGAGSGFMAALLAHRAQQVISLEIRPALVRMARNNLHQARISNAEIREADGAAPTIGGGPFDAIVLSGSVAVAPAHLLSHLKVGGRLVGIIGSEPMMRAERITRISEKDYRTEVLFDTVAPRLDGFREPTQFRF